MDEEKSLAQDIAAFRKEFNETAVECQKFCYITRAKEFQVQALDRLIPLKAKATQLKELTITGRYEDAANAMLSYEEMTESLINELSMWIALKNDEPATAWNFLINAQMAASEAMAAHSVANHLEGYVAHLTALEENIFPNHGFYSIGAIITKSECSICGQEFGECDHLPGRPYMGEICHQYVTEYDLEETSIVFSPANKHCRITKITIDGVWRDTLTWKDIPDTPTAPNGGIKQIITKSPEELSTTENLEREGRMKLFLPRIDSNEEICIELRSDLNHALLAQIGREGVYLWERKARTHHFLSWEELLKCYHTMQQGKPTQSRVIY